ncbi:MAG TPA: cellulose biosynthesis protein BcsG [Anaeromyxobacteraceae bacterium]|nr:cellulose biosynthesis protein BcsG [Anaeromyxobacteraceae bacterium]
MGTWASYFLAAAYLHFRGAIRLEPIPNIVLALILSAPLPRAAAGRRLWRGARHALAAAAGVALLWRESWLPSPARAARLLGETGGVSPAYAIRVLAGAVNLVDVLVVLALLAASLVLARRMVLAPLAFAAILSVPLFGASRGGAGVATEIDGFFDAESRRSVRFPERAAGEDLDVVLLHVCSMSWDDLRQSGLDQTPFLRQFDLLLSSFNTVSSYTNPSAIRLLRAPCGQARHTDLYRTTRRECYLLDALGRAGYQTWSAVDNDAPSYRFVEDIQAHGHADAPLALDGLPVRQVDFDGTPIHDDGALLARWLEARGRSAARRAALYADLTTLHSGAHDAGDDLWWQRSRKELYREAGLRLFANLETFFRALQASGRRTLVVFVPEHGMALAGASFQPADVREIPLPSITTVPVALKLVGPGLPPTPARQATVAKPTSYLAIAHLVASALEAPALRPEALFSEEALARIPETRFVAENEAAMAVRVGDQVLWRGKGGDFAPAPGLVTQGGGGAH